MDVSQLKVLDAGCGTGNYIEYFKLLGIQKIHGIDGSQQMIAKVLLFFVPAFFCFCFFFFFLKNKTSDDIAKKKNN